MLIFKVISIECSDLDYTVHIIYTGRNYAKNNIERNLHVIKFREEKIEELIAQKGDFLHRTDIKALCSQIT